MSDERPLTREERLLVGQVAAAYLAVEINPWVDRSGEHRGEGAIFRGCWDVAETFVRARPEHLDPSKAPVDADLYVTEQEVAEAAAEITIAGLTDPDPEAAMRRVANAYLEFDQKRQESARACADAAAEWFRVTGRTATGSEVGLAQVDLRAAAHRWIKLTEKAP